jgi:hypothetical protein
MAGTTPGTRSRQNTQYVTITGIADTAATNLNLVQVPITAVPSSTTFTVTAPSAVTATYTTGLSGGWISGIPDSLNKVALGTSVYQQTNFWRADDHNYTGVSLPVFTGTVAIASASSAPDGVGSFDYTYVTTTAHGLHVGQLVETTGSSVLSFDLPPSPVTSIGDSTHFTVGGQVAPTAPTSVGGQLLPPESQSASAFINNVSQWCSTCHTRYLAASNSKRFASGDPIYTYRHTSNNAGEDNPNCIQCHVAHGSNATMTGAFSMNLNNPGDSSANNNSGSADPGDSRLLRVNNRGVCLLCHNT